MRRGMRVDNILKRCACALTTFLACDNLGPVFIGKVQRMIFRIAAAAVFMAMAQIAVAADFDAGQEAYERGDYATAFREFHPLAEQGDADAQFNLGVMYGRGEGVPQDYAEAAAWYRRAAEQGDANAQYNLGVKYEQGKGVLEDFVFAYAWFNLAVAQGNENAREDREAIRGLMTRDQIAEAQKLSRELDAQIRGY